MENIIVKVQNENVSDKQLIGYLDTMGLAQKLTDKEKTQFLEISKAFGLNPFKREIYCSKYGETMSIITGYEVYIKRAERSGQLDGWQVITEGKVEDNSLKAIITIYRKDRKIPFIHEVYYSEYVQKTNAGPVNKFWMKAFTMTKKVAIAQGFRLCFSDELGGMPYTSDEMDTKIEDVNHIEIQEATVIPELFKTLDEKWLDAEQKLGNSKSVDEMVETYKSLDAELKKDKRVIDLCAEIKLHYNPIPNA